MAYSRVTKIGDGVSTQFVVNFALGYISQGHITARVGTETDGLGQPIFRAITYISDNLLQIAGTPAGIGVPILFERTVPKSALLVDYGNGDVLDEVNLDISQKQTMHAVHEVVDGRFATLTQNLDLGTFKGVNSGVPTAPNDLVTKAYVDVRFGDFTAVVDDVPVVSGIATEIELVAGIADDVTSVAAVAADVSTVADNIAAISGTAASLLISEKLFVGDGVQTSWTLDRAPASEANIDVWVGGVIQKSANFSVVGSTLVITPAVSNTVEILTKVRVELSASELTDLVNEAEGYRDEAAAYADVVRTDYVVRSFAGNGSTVAFDLAVNPGSKNNCFVNIDGVPQLRSSYSLAGTVLTFTSAPPGDGVELNIEVVFGTALDIGTPADLTVTNAKLATDSVNARVLNGSDATALRAELGIGPTDTLALAGLTLGGIPVGASKILKMQVVTGTGTPTNNTTTMASLGNAFTVTRGSTTSRLAVLALAYVTGASSAVDDLGCVLEVRRYNGTAYVLASAGMPTAERAMFDIGGSPSMTARGSVVLLADLSQADLRTDFPTTWTVQLWGATKFASNTLTVSRHGFLVVEYEP